MALQTLGITTFRQSGPARWHPEGWDLDRVIIPWEGYVDGLESFLSSNPAWSTCPINGNMYLSDASVDDSKRWVHVDLTYIGKRTGQLPPPRNHTGYTVQQAQFQSFPSLEPAVLRITVTYRGPTSSRVIWSRTPIDVAAIGAGTPANVTGIVGRAHAESTTLPTTLAAMLAYFTQIEVMTGDSEEIVPGQYYRGTQTKQNLLESIQF